MKQLSTHGSAIASIGAVNLNKGTYRDGSIWDLWSLDTVTVVLFRRLKDFNTHADARGLGSMWKAVVTYGNDKNAVVVAHPAGSTDFFRADQTGRRLPGTWVVSLVAPYSELGFSQLKMHTGCRSLYFATYK